MSFSDNFDDFLTTFRDGLVVLATTSLQDFVEDAKKDGEAYLEEMKDSVKRWGDALEQGQLNKAEFESLIKGAKSLAKLHLLTAAGLAKARLEHFRTGLLSLITSSVYKLLGI